MVNYGNFFILSNNFIYNYYGGPFFYRVKDSYRIYN